LRKHYWVGLFVLAGLTRSIVVASDFQFDRDILDFRNSTVFKYREGHIEARKNSTDKSKAYTRRCFVMTRTVVQFHKFARFEPRGAPLDDKTLAARIHMVTRQHPWDEALPDDKRVAFPGYANLRELSKARGRLFQENIGLGWPTYARPGNFRMFFQHGDKYQVTTQANLNAVLAHGDLFVGYLSSYPFFTINHAVLVYVRKPLRPNSDIEHYLVYDPNHPDAPRVLRWSPTMRIFNYEKDEEFVGGYTRVYQVYGKWLQ
jgi:hypothetical protein